MSSDWQIDLKSWKDRNLYILRTGLRSDCSFLAGENAEYQSVFRAHKFILATASPVFERMFYGELAEKGDIIEIPDIDADDFEALLQCIYTDEMRFDSMERAQNLYYAATKYMLSQLKEMCVLYLKRNAAGDNVCGLFEFSRKFDEAELEEQCKKRIIGETNFVLQSNFFLDAKISTLEFILDQDELCMSGDMSGELELFRALERYAKNRFTINKRQKKQNDSIQNNNEEKKTEDETCENETAEDFLTLLGKIRFLTLTVDEFLGGPAASNLICESDALNIALCIRDPQRKPNLFPVGFNDSVERRINTKCLEGGCIFVPLCANCKRYR